MGVMLQNFIFNFYCLTSGVGMRLEFGYISAYTRKIAEKIIITLWIMCFDGVWYSGV